MKILNRIKRHLYKIRLRMITEKQKDYILDLYKDIDLEPKEDLDELTKEQASELIQELLEIKEEIS